MEYVLLIALQSVIFALIDIFAKIVLRTVPVFTFLFLRFAFASIGAIICYGKTIVSDIKKTEIKHFILPAVCQGLAINLSNVALKLTAATTYSFVRSMGALVPPVILCIFYGRKYKKQDFFLQFFLIVGLYLLTVKGGFNGFGAGEIVAVSVAILCALSLVFASDSIKYVHSQTVSAFQIFFGLLISIIFGIFSGNFAETDVSLLLDKKIIGVVLFNSLLGTLVGYSLQNIALKKLSAKVVGIAQCLYPVFTAIGAYFILQERMTFAGVIGALVITACVVVQTLLND